MLGGPPQGAEQRRAPRACLVVLLLCWKCLLLLLPVCSGSHPRRRQSPTSPLGLRCWASFGLCPLADLHSADLEGGGQVDGKATSGRTCRDPARVWPLVFEFLTLRVLFIWDSFIWSQRVPYVFKHFRLQRV